MSTEKFIQALTADYTCMVDDFATGAMLQHSVAQCIASRGYLSYENNPGALRYDLEWRAMCSIYVADIDVFIYKGFEFATLVSLEVSPVPEKNNQETLEFHFLDSSNEKMLQWKKPKKFGKNYHG